MIRHDDARAEGNGHKGCHDPGGGALERVYGIAHDINDAAAT